MTTDILTSKCPDYILKWEQIKEPVFSCPFHEPFCHATHSVLQVVFDDPQPENFDVKVFDGSNGSSIPVTIKSTDTTDTLIKMYRQMNPKLQGNLHLAYNGKHVPKHKSMRELGVKPGAMFITYQKCTGG
ncbi:hypothetical protein Q7C36_001955 [Tachysurus vachellii]|uniref:Ubiquitin-like domain-containing protein n=1 Tax=Tachysurus vachellii TaxID=175792 RepID=A0AA88P608_TACVA|nr:hypothetical protein Q7C36_001955 [Tachysurus vachellii]